MTGTLENRGAKSSLGDVTSVVVSRAFFLWNGIQEWRDKAKEEKSHLHRFPLVLLIPPKTKRSAGNLLKCLVFGFCSAVL